MALTSTQKVQIRGFLGYPLDSTVLDPKLDSISADAEVEVERILAQISDVETRLSDARDVAGLKKVNLVEFYQGSAVSELAASGNALVVRLARALDVEVAGLPFGGGAGVDGPGLVFFGA